MEFQLNNNITHNIYHINWRVVSLTLFAQLQVKLEFSIQVPGVQNLSVCDHQLSEIQTDYHSIMLVSKRWTSFIRNYAYLTGLKCYKSTGRHIG